VLREAAGDMALVAEIMGNMPDYIRRAIDDLAVPSLTFPQLERRADRSLVPPPEYRQLSLVSYANHDHAPLAALYTHLHEKAQEDPGCTAAIDLRNMLQFAGWTEPPPKTFDERLLAALQRALFATPCWLAALLSSDLFGTAQRFNLPGSYGANTWNQRLELPLTECPRHSVFGPRIATAQHLIRASDRHASP
jgi:4-alpha-glucanotransferase